METEEISGNRKNRPARSPRVPERFRGSSKSGRKSSSKRHILEHGVSVRGSDDDGSELEPGPSKRKRDKSDESVQKAKRRKEKRGEVEKVEIQKTDEVPPLELTKDQVPPVGRRKVPIELNRDVDPDVGMVCWVLVKGFPWWPARVVDRDAYEKTLELDEDDVLPPATDTNVMVEFFDDDRLTGVVEQHEVCEYTCNMHLVRQTGRPRNDIVQACRMANEYITMHGTNEQRQRFDQLEPFEEFVKPGGGKRKSKPASSTPPAQPSPTPRVSPEERREKKRRRSTRRSLPAEGSTTTPKSKPNKMDDDALGGSSAASVDASARKDTHSAEPVITRMVVEELVPPKPPKIAPVATRARKLTPKEELLGVIQDLENGAGLVDEGLRVEQPDLHHLRMVNGLVLIGMQKLNGGTNTQRANDIVSNLQQAGEAIGKALNENTPKVQALCALVRLVIIGLKELRVVTVEL